MKILIILFVVHFWVFVVFLLLRIFRIVLVDYTSLFIMLFIPVWGTAMMLDRFISDKNSDRQAWTIEVEHPSADEEKKSITLSDEDNDIIPLSEALVINDPKVRRELMLDILYNVNKSIVIDEDEMKEKVVPLEEALVVNDTATRRSLIIDVLYTNPGGFVSQLYDAKANGDTEVVHYAATALTEIQKDFDLQFQDIMERKALSPDDESIDNEYQVLLEEYISSGLLEGDGLKQQLKIYSELLGKRLMQDGIKGRWTLLNKKANADLKRGDTDALDEVVESMISRWPDREGGYLFKIQSAVLKKDKALIKSVIQEIRDHGIYISSELRSIVSFWDDTDKKVETIG